MNDNTPTDEPLTVDAMRPKHRCQPIARAVAMEEGRDWWIGELIEPVPEWPHETHCLHMKTPIKYVVFLCNSGDFEQLLVMSNVVTQLKNLQWLESMTEMAITRAGNDPDHGFTAEEIAEFEKAEDRVDAWLQTKGVEIARAAAIKAAASGPQTCQLLGYPDGDPRPRDQRWCLTHNQLAGKCEFPAATTSAAPSTLEQVIQQLEHNPQVCVCKPFCVHWEVWAKKVIAAAFTSTRSQLLKQIREAVEAEQVEDDGSGVWDAGHYDGINDALAAIDRVANETSET